MSNNLDGPKGTKIDNRRTICEVHRELYDRLVLALADRPQLLEQLVPLLEEAFNMGISMNNKLIEHALSTDDLFPVAPEGTLGKFRHTRQELLKILEQNKRASLTAGKT